MRTVRATAELPLDPARALGLWTDLDRWPGFVEGFARIVDVEQAWPAAGAAVVWESGPDGRGRVSERVIELDPERRLVTEVAERPAGGGPLRLHGRQTFEVGAATERAAAKERGAATERAAAPERGGARAGEGGGPEGDEDHGGLSREPRPGRAGADDEHASAVDRAGPRSRAELRLEYELARGPGAPGRVTDLLFVRGAMRDALGRTLERFAAEAAHEAAR